MARRDVTADAPVDTTPDTTSVEALMSAENDATEWETVEDESPIRVILDQIGDAFIGVYEGTYTVPAEQNITKDHPEGEEFTLFIFRGLDGKPYAMNQSHKLATAMAKVNSGEKVRITLTKEIETDRGLNPMKDFKVDVAKRA